MGSGLRVSGFGWESLRAKGFESFKVEEKIEAEK